MTGGGQGIALPQNRVLVVDNDHDIVDAQALLLEALGQDVQRAYDGPTALRIAWDFRPDVVILDVQMPGMDGIEVARQLRAIEWMQAALIVAHSGLPWAQLRLLALEPCFDAYMPKPAPLATLVELLQRVRTATATSSPPAPAAPARERSGDPLPDGAAPPPTAAG